MSRSKVKKEDKDDQVLTIKFVESLADLNSEERNYEEEIREIDFTKQMGCMLGNVKNSINLTERTLCYTTSRMVQFKFTPNNIVDFRSFYLSVQQQVGTTSPIIILATVSISKGYIIQTLDQVQRLLFSFDEMLVLTICKTFITRLEKILSKELLEMISPDIGARNQTFSQLLAARTLESESRRKAREIANEDVQLIAGPKPQAKPNQPIIPSQPQRQSAVAPPSESGYVFFPLKKQYLRHVELLYTYLNIYEEHMAQRGIGTKINIYELRELLQKFVEEKKSGQPVMARSDTVTDYCIYRTIIRLQTNPETFISV